MAKRSRQEYLMISLEKGVELYLATMATEGKSPRYIGWLKTRLRFFQDYIRKTHGEGFPVQDLALEDGRGFIRALMAREKKYTDHPFHQPRKGKLSIQYIHGCGRAIRSFSTWAYEEGYLEENILRRMKLPHLPQTLPRPLSEKEIQLVLAAALETTRERLRNFSMLVLFLDTGIRLSELVNLKQSQIDFTIRGDDHLWQGEQGAHRADRPAGQESADRLPDAGSAPNRPTRRTTTGST